MHPPVEEDRSYRRALWSWALYDVGNSAFFLTIVAAIFPPFFQEVYAHREGSGSLSARTQGGSALAYTAGIAMAVVAVLGPLLGALADRVALKKRLLAGFAGLGIVSSGLMIFIGDGNVALAATLYALGTIGVAGSMVFYDALLPHVARPQDLDRASTLGFAAGYLGSVALFILNCVALANPGWFGLADAGQAARASFASVAVWWAAFTIPILRNVREPAVKAGPGRGAFRELGETFARISRSKPLLLFLLAYWVYSDGIGTIIKMATAFGYSLGIGQADLMKALILTQLIGVPCALGFGRLAGRIGAKAGILIGLAVYLGICVFARVMSQPWHFYVLAGAVGLVQGGTQALSRSLFASMVPPTRTGEYFGFFSTMEKFAGILGPVLLGFLWSEGGDPRRGIVWIGLFFLLGGGMLAAVNVARGREQAKETP